MLYILWGVTGSGAVMHKEATLAAKHSTHVFFIQMTAVQGHLELNPSSPRKTQ